MSTLEEYLKRLNIPLRVLRETEETVSLGGTQELDKYSVKLKKEGSNILELTLATTPEETAEFLKLINKRILLLHLGWFPNLNFKLTGHTSEQATEGWLPLVYQAQGVAYLT